MLTGDRKGTWRLSVARNWRLTFRIDAAERPTCDVNLEIDDGICLAGKSESELPMTKAICLKRALGSGQRRWEDIPTICVRRDHGCGGG